MSKKGDGRKETKAGSRKKAELKPRQLKAIEGLLDGKSARRAALDAGYTESMANDANRKVFTAPVRDVLAAKLDAIGCTDDHLARRILEGTNAEMVKIASFEGEISDERFYADMEQRGKYIDRALELKGHIKRNGAAVEVNMPIMLMHNVPRPQYQPGNQALSGHGNK